MKKEMAVLLAIFISACANTPEGSNSRRAGEPCDNNANIKCIEGLQCVEGLCRRACLTFKNCGKKQLCEENYCVDEPNGNCWPGWIGASCENCAKSFFGNDCAPCPSCVHGTCLDGMERSGECQCSEGWAGTLCTECDAGFYGPDCQECPACGEHGSCMEGRTGDGQCRCQADWTGPLCEIELQDLNEPCDADTDCKSGLVCDEYAQKCQKACKSVDDCDEGQSCQDDGHCSNCPEGFKGQECDQCRDRRYGSSCAVCDCLHGTCSEGKEGRGDCLPKTCQIGWRGNYCSECDSLYWGSSCQNKCECNTAHSQGCIDGLNGTGCICSGNWTDEKCNTCDTAKGYGPDCVSYGKFNYQGAEYKTVVINGQTWMAENLRATKDKTGQDVVCNFVDQDFYNKYGCLYPWNATENICPTGWRMPTVDDFNKLLAYVAQKRTAASDFLALIAKSDAWKNFPNQGLDEFGFAALPAGNKGSSSFANSGDESYFWSSSVKNANTNSLYIGVRNYTVTNAKIELKSQSFSFSVRCLED